MALVGYERERLDLIRANRNKPRADYLSDRGRLIHGPTPPGGSKPSPRESDLSPEEVEEVLELISTGRKTRTPVDAGAASCKIMEIHGRSDSST